MMMMVDWPACAWRGGGEMDGAAKTSGRVLRLAPSAMLDLHRPSNTLLCSGGADDEVTCIQAEGITEALSRVFGATAEGCSFSQALERLTPETRAVAAPVIDHLLEIGVLFLSSTTLPPLSPPRTEDLVVRRPRQGTSVHYVGHTSIVVETARAAVAIDPMIFALGPRAWRLLSRRQGSPSDGGGGSEAVPPPLSTFPPLSAVAISHSHEDHLDPFTLMWLDKRTPIVVPRINDRLKNDVMTLGFDAVTELESWTSHKLEDITLTRVPSSDARDEKGRITEQCTWHIATSDVRIFFGTDMLHLPDVFARVAAELGSDLCFLPISGHHIKGRKETMDDADALDAARLLRPKLAVPYSGWDHWWLPTTSERFSGSRRRFVDSAIRAGIVAELLPPGARLWFEDRRLTEVEPAENPLAPSDIVDIARRATFGKTESAS